jgi:D-arginine dehydrogenase
MDCDIAIIGAGMAGASLAAEIGDVARVILIEAEDQPGRHTTGRSAAFWAETYGGAVIQPLTSASGPWLAERGFLHPRGALYITDVGGEAALARRIARLVEAGVKLRAVDRAGLEALVPGIRPAWTHGLLEEGCKDIDVAGLHAHYLAAARRVGAVLLTDAEVTALRRGDRWTITTKAGAVTARVVVNAAGAWAGRMAELAGALPIAITPLRRTIVQLRVDPPTMPAMPLVLDARAGFYFKPDAGGRLWLSPQDETPQPAGDAAADELDVALAIDRLEQVVDWRIAARERAWAGLRSFTPDRAPVYGFDPRVPGFFWFAGQGGFGIQTAPAAARIGAALLLGREMPEDLRGIDVPRYLPGRFE